MHRPLIFYDLKFMNPIIIVLGSVIGMKINLGRGFRQRNHENSRLISFFFKCSLLAVLTMAINIDRVRKPKDDVCFNNHPWDLCLTAWYLQCYKRGLSWHFFQRRVFLRVSFDEIMTFLPSVVLQMTPLSSVCIAVKSSGQLSTQLAPQ